VIDLRYVAEVLDDIVPDGGADESRVEKVKEPASPISKELIHIGQGLHHMYKTCNEVGEIESELQWNIDTHECFEQFPVRLVRFEVNDDLGGKHSRHPIGDHPASLILRSTKSKGDTYVNPTNAPMRRAPYVPAIFPSDIVKIFSAG
jgi:hypothetical protein